MKRVVLAYSGGLDTSVAVRWLRDRYSCDVITVTVDVGQGVDEEGIRRRSVGSGAEKAYVVDARQEFLSDYAFRALRANALYEGQYPLSSALSRPLITRIMIDIAGDEGADAIAHGCTGKGNDQVRFDVSAQALAPGLKVVAPARDWGMSREDSMAYAASRGIPVPTGKENPYSIDDNLWGRSIECGVLEDPWTEPPKDIYEMTIAPEDCPEQPTYLEIEFNRGVPVAVNGIAMDPVKLVSYLNNEAGAQGVGRMDHVENRLVGIKSREIYEAPAAVVLVTAHRDLEDLTLTREVARCKGGLEATYADLVYNGLWFSPLRDALDAFMDSTQNTVTGTVRLKLHRGNVSVVGRKSPLSLYDFGLATYDHQDAFDHSSAVGFIELWGLPTRVASGVRRSHQRASLPSMPGSGESGE